jgi:hypothetical protein
VVVKRFVGGSDRGSGDRFDLRYLDLDVAGAVERRAPLTTCWAARFEDVAPVRRFPSYQGQRSFSGLYFAACMNRHVGFESWLERDQLTMLDFSPQVRAFSAQPFWLLWSCLGKARRHAPDFFVRLRDGTGVVVDVRADDRIAPEDAEAFEVTAVACASVGWGYRRVGELDPVLAANMRWLAGIGILAACGRSTGLGCWRCSPSRRRCWLGLRLSVIGSRCCRRCFTCCGPGCSSPT